MIKLVTGIIIAFLYKSTSRINKNIYKEEVPKSMLYKEIKLIQNGQGTRLKFFMKVYDTSLYLVSKSSNAEEILNNDQTMAISIDITSTMVTTDAMKDAMEEGLVKSTGNNTGPITKEIEQLISTFNSDVTENDFYEFIYICQMQEQMY
jgi:hypothetical protein